jgi:hypothetical protein
MKTAHDRKPSLIIEGLNEEITTQSEKLYEDLVDKEGYSEEQANQIALTTTGKGGGLMDENFEGGETEDELVIHSPKNAELETHGDIAGSLRKARLNDH